MAVDPGNSELAPSVKDSIERPRRWIRVGQEYMDQFIFSDFIKEMLVDIETNPVPEGYNNERCILWDNLILHKTAYVILIIRYKVGRNDF